MKNEKAKICVDCHYEAKGPGNKCPQCGGKWEPENEKAKHTPVPWETMYNDGDTSDCHYAIQRHAGASPYIARIAAANPGGVPEANGAFIVRACNAHEDLLAALETIHSILAGAMCNPTLIDRGFLIGIARAAIAKAKGGINL